MEVSCSYVLVIADSTNGRPILESLRSQCNFSMVFASSLEQGVTYLKKKLPYLVIFSEHRTAYMESLLQRLRSTAYQHHACNLMIVALTDVNDPSWLPQDENPGFDGFLVKPLSGDILSSLVQSAWIRQACCAAS